MKKRVDLIIYAVVFALILALPIAAMNHVPGKISETENRYLAMFPEVYDSEGHLTSGLKNEVETWLGDNLGFRSDFMKLAANIKLKLFHQTTSDRVEIGQDGWYFYTLDNNLDIARGEYPDFDEGVLQTICREQEKIRDKLAAQGIEYVLILPASKVSIYPEYIASGDYTVTRTPSDILADYLEQHSDIHVVRLKDALLAAKDTGQLYFKTDTHWNQRGAYVVCSKIIEDMNSWGMINAEPSQVTFETGKFKGEFSAMLGDKDLLEPEECPVSIIADATAEEVADGPIFETIGEILGEKAINTPFWQYENLRKASAPKVLHFGDSLFGGEWNARELLAEQFSQYTYIWDTNIWQDLIDAVQPDIVLYEIGERYLNWLPTKSIQFIKGELADYEAEILDYTIEDDSIEVTVQNTSQSIWGYEDEVRLSIWRNGDDSGLRAYLPMDRVIMPGETVIFTFENIDTTDLLKGELELWMMQEGVRYFGEREVVSEYPQARELGLSAQIVSHDAPTVVNRTDSYDIQITAKNTSTAAWSEQDEIRLCIWQDGTDYGYRIALPDGVSVMPGEEYTFTLENFVAPPVDHTELAFQMVKDGVSYFGEQEFTDIMVSE